MLVEVISIVRHVVVATLCQLHHNLCDVNIINANKMITNKSIITVNNNNVTNRTSNNQIITTATATATATIVSESIVKVFFMGIAQQHEHDK